jgi:hypothetical protein
MRFNPALLPFFLFLIHFFLLSIFRPPASLFLSFNQIRQYTKSNTTLSNYLVSAMSNRPINHDMQTQEVLDDMQTQEELDDSDILCWYSNISTSGGGAESEDGL